MSEPSAAGTTGNTKNEDMWTYVIVFALVNVFAVSFVGVMINQLGYHWNVGRMVALLLIVDLLAFPAFLLVKKAESGKGHWGGAAETWGILFIGTIILLLGLAVLPPEVKRWVEEIFSPYESAQLLTRPRTKFATPDKPAPEGTERVFVTLPDSSRGGPPNPGDIKGVFVQVRVTPEVAVKNGVLIDAKHSELRVWYETSTQKSFTDDN